MPSHIASQNLKKIVVFGATGTIGTFLWTASLNWLIIIVS